MKGFSICLKETPFSKLKKYKRYYLKNLNLSAKLMSISVKDIIELGFGSTYKGKKVLKLAQVIKIKKDYIEAIDLSRPSFTLSIPVNQLYEKQELTGKPLASFEEKQLYAMGAQKLWIKLTPRQHRAYITFYRTENLKKVDDEQIEFLRNWFMSSKDESKKEPVFKFPEPIKEKRESPLGRFISKRNYEKNE